METQPDPRTEPTVNLAYVDSGDRPTLLLIHGFPLNSGMWTQQMEALGDYARVIAPDLRGHGNSSTSVGSYSVEMLAEDCADLLEYLGVTSPLVVCGHSMGGYVALEFFRRHADRVAGLVLNSTRAGADSKDGKAHRDEAAGEVQAKGIGGLVDEMLGKVLASDTAGTKPELSSSVRELMASTTVAGAVGALAVMRDRPDSTTTLGSIEVPVLIVHGREDQVIPASEAELMHAAIAHSKLVLIEGAGHLPNLEQPDQFNAAIAEFLLEVEAGWQDSED